MVIIKRPDDAIGRVYCRDTSEDVYNILADVGTYLSHYEDEPVHDHWGQLFEITVTVRKLS